MCAPLPREERREDTAIMRCFTPSVAVRALVRLCAVGVSLPAYKSLLQEHCHASGKFTPTYEIVGEDGPPHQRAFQAQCAIEGDGMAAQVWTGEWQRSIKGAEGSAAQVALKSLGVTDPTPRPQETTEGDRPSARKKKPANPHPTARGDLLAACDCNGWPPPVLETRRIAPSTESPGAEFVATLRLVGTKSLPAAEALGEFCGCASRKTAAESIASAAALAAVTELLGDRIEGSAGSMEALRALAVRRGLLLEAEGSSCWLGGKRTVLRLQTAPENMRAHSSTPSCSPVVRCPMWSGVAIGGNGVGLTKQSCLDAAASEVLALLGGGGGAASVADGSDSSRAAAATAEDTHTSGIRLHDLERLEPLPDYAPRQAVFATDDADAMDDWLRRNVGPATGGSPIRAVALDAEWDASLRNPSASIIQIATRTACLVAYVGNKRCLPPGLRSLLADRNIAKVGKDLRHDCTRDCPALRSAPVACPMLLLPAAPGRVVPYAGPSRAGP